MAWGNLVVEIVSELETDLENIINKISLEWQWEVRMKDIRESVGVNFLTFYVGLVGR